MSKGLYTLRKLPRFAEFQFTYSMTSYRVLKHVGSRTKCRMIDGSGKLITFGKNDRKVHVLRLRGYNEDEGGAK